MRDMRACMEIYRVGRQGSGLYTQGGAICRGNLQQRCLGEWSCPPSRLAYLLVADKLPNILFEVSSPVWMILDRSWAGARR